MREKLLECKRCKALFVYSGVGRPPTTCPTCRNKKEEIVGEEVRDSVLYLKIARFNKEGEITGYYFVRKDEA